MFFDIGISLFKNRYAMTVVSLDKSLISYSRVRTFGDLQPLIEVVKVLTIMPAAGHHKSSNTPEYQHHTPARKAIILMA